MHKAAKSKLVLNPTKYDSKVAGYDKGMPEGVSPKAQQSPLSRKREITSHLVGVVCRPSGMASCYIRVRERARRASDVPRGREIRFTGQFEMFGKPAGIFIQGEATFPNLPLV